MVQAAPRAHRAARGERSAQHAASQRGEPSSVGRNTKTSWRLQMHHVGRAELRYKAGAPGSDLGCATCDACRDDVNFMSPTDRLRT